MKKGLILTGLFVLVAGVVAAQQKKAQQAQPKKEQAVKQEEVMQVIKSGLSSDPRLAWKVQQDEAQRICSQYPMGGGPP